MMSSFSAGTQKQCESPERDMMTAWSATQFVWFKVTTYLRYVLIVLIVLIVPMDAAKTVFIRDQSLRSTEVRQTADQHLIKIWCTPTRNLLRLIGG